jgi:hypothetical protein
MSRFSFSNCSHCQPALPLDKLQIVNAESVVNTVVNAVSLVKTFVNAVSLVKTVVNAVSLVKTVVNAVSLMKTVVNAEICCECRKLGKDFYEFSKLGEGCCDRIM